METKLAHLRKDTQCSSHMNCVSAVVPSPLCSHLTAPWDLMGAPPEIAQSPVPEGFLLLGLASPPGTFFPVPAVESRKSLSSRHLGRCFLAS